MKAFVARAYGGPEVMALGELPEPTACKGEVVVEVRASSVNPVDWKVRDGIARILSGWKFPKAFGCEFAGVVATTGPGVNRFARGDAVYGVTLHMLGKPGAHAERVAVASRWLHPLPPGISFEQGATLPVSALTAQNGLKQCGPLVDCFRESSRDATISEAGIAGYAALGDKSVLINGATGGVGHFAVQIAKAWGAEVTAVCSARNAERAKALGADFVIDYAVRDFASEEKRYDVVFDAFGHLPFAAALPVLHPRGVYVTTLGTPTLVVHAAWQKVVQGTRIVFANAWGKPGDYATLERLILAGQVRPLISRVFPLEQAAAAFAALEDGGTPGKIVIQVSQG